MKKILFVCTGNICRSVIAEHLFKKILKDKKIVDIEVGSAGIDGNPEYRIYGILAELMTEKGIDYSKHISTKITDKHLADCDLIIVMEQLHQKYISYSNPEADGKVKLLKELAGEGKVDIHDPIGKPAEAYKEVFEEINECIKKVAENLIEAAGR